MRPPSSRNLAPRARVLTLCLGVQQDMSTKKLAFGMSRLRKMDDIEASAGEVEAPRAERTAREKKMARGMRKRESGEAERTWERFGLAQG